MKPTVKDLHLRTLSCRDQPYYFQKDDRVARAPQFSSTVTAIVFKKGSLRHSQLAKICWRIALPIMVRQASPTFRRNDAQEECNALRIRAFTDDCRDNVLPHIGSTARRAVFEFAEQARSSEASAKIVKTFHVDHRTSAGRVASRLVHARKASFEKHHSFLGDIGAAAGEQP